MLLLATAERAKSNEPAFTLTNGRGTSAVRLFVSPSNARNWGNDILTTNTLAPHASLKIPLPPGSCNYDISIVWSDGNSQTRRGLDVCQKSGITIF